MTSVPISVNVVPDKSVRRHIAGFLGAVAAFLIFCLPLKFGSITGVPELPYIPKDIASWIIFTYPGVFFSFASGILLLSVLLIVPVPKNINYQRLSVMLWFLLAFVTLIGAINASVKDFVILEVTHFFGIASFCASAYLLIRYRPGMKLWFITAVLLGTLAAAAQGIQQVIWGFKESLDYVYKEEVRTGFVLTGNLRDRMLQTRVYSTFSLCNSFAAHIILTLPFLSYIWFNINILKITIIFTATCIFLFVFQFCDTAGLFIISLLFSAVTVFTIFRFPVKKQHLLAALMIFIWSAILLWLLYMTESRAGILALSASALGMCIFIFLVKYRRLNIWKAAAVFLGGACVMSVIFYVMSIERGLGSFQVRLDYDIAAMKIFFKHPFTGTGWGDFFHEYTRIKTFPGEEAPHDPHNFIMSFASQAGIAGLLAATVLLLFPAAIFLLRISRNENLKSVMKITNILLLMGWYAWALHSLMDINFQIAGTAATAGLILLFPDFMEENLTIGPNILKKVFGSLFFYTVCLLSVIFSSLLGYYRIKGEFAYDRLYSICEPRFVTKEEFFSVPVSRVEDELEKCEKLMPYSPYPWLETGSFAQYRDIPSLAEPCYEMAVKLSPERAAYYYRLALAQLRLGRKDDAIKNLETAAALFPNAGYKKTLEKIRQEK